MFDNFHYIPMLKAKAAELFALAELEEERRAVLTPFLDIPNVAWNYSEERYKKTLRDHLTTKVERITEVWAGESAAFVDFGEIDSGLIEGASPHPVISTIDALRERGLRAIPVSSPGRDEAYQAAVAEVLETHDSGVCIRLDGATLSPGSIESTLESATDSVGARRDDVHLIFDFGPLDTHQSAMVETAAESVVASLPKPDEWQSLTFAATAFPRDMSPFEPDSVNEVPRLEWGIWNYLIGSRRLDRLPAFGDYTTNHPALLDVDPRLITMAAKLRYTRNEDWLIYRGRDVNRYDYEQRNQFARDLVDRDDFRGPDYSAGDEFNHLRGTGQEASPGNAMQWLFADVNHHLAVVADQISSLSAS